MGVEENQNKKVVFISFGFMDDDNIVYFWFSKYGIYFENNLFTKTNIPFQMW